MNISSTSTEPCSRHQTHVWLFFHLVTSSSLICLCSFSLTWIDFFCLLSWFIYDSSGPPENQPLVILWSGISESTLLLSSFFRSDLRSICYCSRCAQAPLALHCFAEAVKQTYIIVLTFYTASISFACLASYAVQTGWIFAMQWLKQNTLWCSSRESWTAVLICELGPTATKLES